MKKIVLVLVALLVGLLNVQRAEAVPYRGMGDWLKTLRGYFEAGLDPVAPGIAAELRWKTIEAVVKKHNLFPEYDEGYYFINSVQTPDKLTRGERDEVSVLQLDRFESGEKTEEIEKAKKKMPGLYKIHLMPKKKEFMEVFERVLKGVSEDEDLQKLIHRFKVRRADRAAQLEEDVKKGEPIFPLMVIYPASGKENAQEALNKLYEIFLDLEGQDITPRYNAKVTGLIYVAQGDGDYKGESKYEKYFEKPHLIYFNPDEIPPLNKTHHLLHPETEQELTSPN